jgi:peptide/nickel transport system permease protein
MRTYIIRRLLLIVPTLFLVSLFVFFTIRLIPGDVIELMVQEGGQAASGSEEEQEAAMTAMRERLGLNIPLHVQYGRWVGDIVLRGDLGESLYTGRSVTQMIKERLPVSFELGLLAMIIALLLAIPMGVYSAIRQDTVGDYVGRSVAIAFIALPSFWIGTIVIVFPSVWWGWMPPISYVPFGEDPLANLGQFGIPAAIMGMVMSGTTMRMTRTMMLEVLRQDYIRTAWSKGLRERIVVFRHALKNALIPVVTIIGLQLPILIGGSVVMEQIFSLPGLGILLVEALNTRDYLVLSGLNIFMATVVLLSILATDLTYGLLDPRVRHR